MTNITELKDKFIQEVKQHQGIELTDVDYSNLKENFRILFSKTSHRKFGYGTVSNTRVYGIFSKRYNEFTKYISFDELDDFSKIANIFFTYKNRDSANFLIAIYKQEVDVFRGFAILSQKEFALKVFADTLFPTQHMEKFLYGKINQLNFIQVIKNHIIGKYDNNYLIQ